MSETVSTPKGQGNVGESPAVFISWSGRHCGQLAAGLKGLLAEVLGKGWEVSGLERIRVGRQDQEYASGLAISSGAGASLGEGHERGV
jgi:hypothetical protein